MKTTWILGAAMFLLAACKSEPAATEEKPAAETTEVKAEAPLPMDVYYKGEAEMGSRDNMIVVMNWNRFLSEKKLDSAKALLGDSVMVQLFDGTIINTTRDSLMNVVASMVNSYDSIKVGYVAAIPINVKTKEGVDEWVFSWTDERYESKNKKEHANIHEDYVLKNGRIVTVYQYRQQPPPEKPAEK